MKRHGSQEGPRDASLKKLNHENSFLAENSIDSINKSFDGFNSSYQDYSRIDGSDDLLQKSTILN